MLPDGPTATVRVRPNGDRRQPHPSRGTSRCRAVAWLAMTAAKRIAILTGGGDVPGLNAVIKSVVYRATRSATVLGIRRGWEGLTHVRPGDEPDPDYLRPLDRINTRTIER